MEQTRGQQILTIEVDPLISNKITVSYDNTYMIDNFKHQLVHQRVHGPDGITAYKFFLVKQMVVE